MTGGDTPRAEASDAADSLPGLVADIEIFARSAERDGRDSIACTYWHASRLAKPYEARYSDQSRALTLVRFALTKLTADAKTCDCPEAWRGTLDTFAGDVKTINAMLDSCEVPYPADMHPDVAEWVEKERQGRLALRAENADLRRRVLELETDCRDLLEGTKRGHAERDQLRAGVEALTERIAKAKGLLSELALLAAEESEETGP